MNRRTLTNKQIKKKHILYDLNELPNPQNPHICDYQNSSNLSHIFCLDPAK